MSDIEIINQGEFDEVKYLPQGVCSKVLIIKIKDEIVMEMEAVGGCSGNLKGVGSLIAGMKIKDIIDRLKGLPCGNRPTSCPDQLAKALSEYTELKQRQHANV